MSDDTADPNLDPGIDPPVSTDLRNENVRNGKAVGASAAAKEKPPQERAGWGTRVFWRDFVLLTLTGIVPALTAPPLSYNMRKTIG